MKKITSSLILVWLLNSCNDGNLTQETINFDTVTTQSCSSNTLVYKIKGQEALLIDIPKTSFPSEPTTINQPTVIDINTTNRVVYRAYNGSISSSTFCGTVPPSSPAVIDEWLATSGKIQITTTAVKTVNATTGRTTIIGYNHNIVFKNITFSIKNGSQVYETFVFGDYITNETALPFNFGQTLKQCSSSKQIYNFNSAESLTLDAIDPNLIVNQITPSGSPRKGLIGTTTNKLVYRSFINGVLTSDYFCNTTAPTTPTVSQEWIAEAGVTDTKGIIEVTTTSGSGTYTHQIVLKKVTFIKGNNNFTLGDSFVLGDLITTN